MNERVKSFVEEQRDNYLQHWEHKIDSLLAGEKLMVDDGGKVKAYTRMDKEFYKIAIKSLKGWR